MRHLTLSLGCLIVSSTCLAQAPNWVKVTTPTSPPGRHYTANAYDFLRGRTIVFGGTQSTVQSNDIWEYDGKTWVEIKPATVPPKTRLHSMVYHPPSANTLLFGGITGVGKRQVHQSATWTWDGTNWTQMQPKNSPSGRAGVTMAYDSARRRTVLFGGFNANNALADTWEWDGTNWTQIMTTRSPSPRDSATMAYDSVRKRTVLFGGEGWTKNFGDTWEYDGKNWTQMNPTTQPSARAGVGLNYDPVRRRTVLYGGYDVANLADTWEYDGTNWTQMKPATQPPGRHDYDLMVYDQRRQRMVVFGGYNKSAETWEYVTPQTLTGSPPTVSISIGGTHTFSLDAGTANASGLYWIFGSVTGTSPGTTLYSKMSPVTLPLVLDAYTEITIGLPNSVFLVKTRGVLDAAGRAQASLVVPKIAAQNAIGVKLYHSYLVYDAAGNYYMTSNPVELKLVK